MRKSRLFKSNFDYIMKQLPVIIRSFSIYIPFRFFSYISALFFIPGAFLVLRFFVYYLINGFEGGNIQSLILATILIIISFLLLMLGVISESISHDRKLLEKIKRILTKKALPLKINALYKRVKILNTIKKAYIYLILIFRKLGIITFLDKFEIFKQSHLRSLFFIYDLKYLIKNKYLWVNYKSQL